MVAVSWGYSRTPAGELGADRLIARMNELPGIVEELLHLAAKAKE